MIFLNESDLVFVKSLHPQAIAFEESYNHQDFVEVLAAGVVQNMTLCLC